MESFIQLYTDGAASGNPGPGGYGVVLLYNNFRKEVSGGYKLTTNNRMELMAVIIGLESIKDKDLKVKIFSDSKYVVDSINLKWIYAWKKINFKEKANVDLWMRFLKIYNSKLHEFIWVKGHANNKENNRCDVLAVAASKRENLEIDDGYQKLKTGGLF